MVAEMQVGHYRVVGTLEDGSLRAVDSEDRLWLLEPVPESVPDAALAEAAELKHPVLPGAAPPETWNGVRYLPVEWPSGTPLARITRMAGPLVLREVRRLCEALELLWRETHRELPRTLCSEALRVDVTGRIR
ncbi:MAG: hypothetical protein AB1758_15330, partial [Candidatus Eremiobacterota bacterium]